LAQLALNVLHVWQGLNYLQVFTREAVMKKIPYLLIMFLSVFALMVASADAELGGHGRGHRGYGGGYGP